MSPPDPERVVSDYLRTHATITPLSTRIVGKTPDSTDGSWVKVVRIGGAQSDRMDHLIGFMLQLDCYAGRSGGQPEANALGDAVRGALTSMSGTYGSTVVSGVLVIDDARVQDPDLTDASGHGRERRILTVEAFMHS